MRVFCDCAAVRIGGGVCRYLASLFAELARLDGDWSFVVAARPVVAERIVPGDPRFSILPVPDTAARSTIVRVAWEQTVLAALARRSRPDVMFCPGNVDLLLASGAGIPSVVALNVSQPWVRPQEFPRLTGLYLRAFVRMSAVTADKFITITEVTRRELARATGIARERIVPIHLGVDISRFRPATPADTLPPWAAAEGIRPPYLLSVSSLRRWKNYDTLIKAYAASAAPRRGVQLVIVGLPLDRALERELRDLAAELGIAERVIIPGPAPEGVLPMLYRLAQAYVFPSLFEGFGLTQIEAMASGIPAAVSSASVMPEVSADAALYFDPTNTADMAQAIDRVLWDDSARERLVAAGLRRAQDFPWQRTARRTLEVLRAVAGRG